MRDVRETNICAIHVHADERTGKLFVFAAIDNLWKGTASQAVANLNLMFGLDERGPGSVVSRRGLRRRAGSARRSTALRT